MYVMFYRKSIEYLPIDVRVIRRKIVMTSRLRNLGTLGLLYFVQGAPYGFQSSCLPIILRKGGLSFTQLGVMKLLFIPWICKPLYAPLVDGTMTKKFWLILTMICLGFTCMITGVYCSIENVMALSVVLFLLNLFSAAQDIAVDSLAVRVLESDEDLGIGNTIQVVAYKGGSIFAGGILLYLENILGWAGMFNVLAFMYFICIFLVTFLNLVEKPEQTVKPSHKDNCEENRVMNSNDNILKNFVNLFSVAGTTWMVCFVMFYKLCERAEQTFSLFLIDKNVPTITLAAWSTVLKTFSLVGSTYTGYYVSKKKVNSMEFPLLGKSN